MSSLSVCEGNVQEATRVTSICKSVSDGVVYALTEKLKAQSGGNIHSSTANILVPSHLVNENKTYLLS